MPSRLGPSELDWQKIAGNQSLLKNILESSFNLIWITDKQGNILHQSKSNNITEISENHLESIHNDDRKLVDAAWKKLIKNGESFAGMVYRHCPADGREIYLQSTAVRFDHEGSTLVLICANDITKKKLEENSLRDSELKFRTLFQHAGAATFLLDEKGSFVDANPSACRKLGRSREELQKLKVWDIDPAYSMKRLKKLFEGIESGQTAEIEAKHTLEDGSAIQVSLRISAMELGKRRIYIVLARDITKRKKVEDELRRERDLVERIMDTSPTAIVQCDRTGNLVYANKPAEALLGLNHSEITKRTYNSPNWKITGLDGIPFDEEKLPFSIVRKTGNAVYNVEHAIELADGQKLLLSVNAAPLLDNDGEFDGMVAVITDITTCKTEQQELEHSKALLRMVMDLVPVYICAKDLDGRFILVNKRLADFYGTTVEELTGVLHGDICEDEEELNWMLADDREVIESGKPKLIPEETMQNPDGSFTVLETQKIPFDIYEKPAVLIASRDVTTQWMLEQERSKAAKLESVGLLAGGIAHDFNNILTTINGNISLAKMLLGLNDHDKLMDILTQSELAGKRAGELTHQLLTFSKGGDPVKKTSALDELITEAAGFALRGSNVKCDYDIDGALWACNVDPGQISQVIHNLVINADQAMPDGGTVTITAHNTICKDEGNLPAPGRYVKIRVEDKGEGIAEEHLAKIFDPYFTTKSKGSGLGLTSCYSIIRKHEGHISVESQPGRGTLFEILLPASDKKPEESYENDGGLDAPASKILLMDDEPTIRDMAKNILLYLGHSVTTANDGIEALELYRQAQGTDDSFDLVILDLTIPGSMGGKETVEKLIELDPDAKVLVSSGYADDPILSQYEKYGFKGMIAKPYDIRQLKSAIHKVLINNN